MSDVSEPIAAPGGSGTREPAATFDHLGAALVAVVAGAGLALLAHQGAVPLIVGVAVVQAALTVSWVLGTALPGRIGALGAGVLAGAAADVLAARWPHGQLGTLLAAFGLALPVLFVHQLMRGVVRVRVVESLSQIALLVVAVIAPAALIPLRHETGGALMATAAVLAVAAALVVGHLVDLVWAGPRFDADVPRGLLAVVVATLAGAAAGYLRLRDTVEFTAGRAAFVGAAVGATVSLLAVGTAFIQTATADRDGRGRWLRPVYGALLPFALTVPVAYLLCLAIRA